MELININILQRNPLTLYARVCIRLLHNHSIDSAARHSVHQSVPSHPSILTAISQHSGKGTPRRTVKRGPARSAGDDKKLQQTLKKLNTQPIPAIEEVNMFKNDGNVIHFAAPKGKIFRI